MEDWMMCHPAVEKYCLVAARQQAVTKMHEQCDTVTYVVPYPKTLSLAVPS